MPHNILFLDQFSEMGGGQRVLYDLLTHFDRKTISPLVALPGQGAFSQKLQEANIPYECGFPVNWGICSYWLDRKRMIRFISGLVEKHQSGLIYVNSPRLLGWALEAAEKKKRKVIWHAHCIVEGFIEKIAAGKWGSQADKIIVNSIATGKSLEGLSPKIEVVYNGIDLTRFSRKLEVPAHPVICAVGRLVKLKGYEDLIACAPRVKNEFPNVKIILAGSTLFGKEQYEEELKDLAKSLRVEDIIVFAGQVENPEEILAVSDLFVHCSRSEGFGLTVVEAMAASKPIVTTDLPAIREIVGNNAYYYKAGNYQELADQIIKLLKSPKESKQMIEQNRKRAQEFSIDKQVKKIEEIISKLLC